MADNSTPENTESTQPRRRRAASRPAGPPPAAVFQAPDPALAEPAAEAPAPAAAPLIEAPAVEEPAPAPATTRRRRATRAAAAPDAPAAETVSEPALQSPEESAPRRRRATRPAAAPDEATTETTGQAAAETEAPAESAPRRRRSTRAAAAPDASAAESETPAEESAQEEAPAPRRRRATREAAAPETSTAAVAEPPQTVAAGAPVTAEQDEPAEEPAPTRRRRATRSAAAPETSAPTVTDVPQTVAAGAPVAADEVEAAEEPAPRRRRATRSAAAPETSAAPETDVPQTTAAGTAHAGASEEAEPDRPRRRRATRPAAAPEPVADTPELTPAEPELEDGDDEGAEDGIAAALRMAEQAAQSRRAGVVDPFTVPAANRDAQLEALAGAIAGDLGENDDADEDTDDDEAEDETTEASEDADGASDESDEDAEDSDSDDDQDADGEESEADGEQERSPRRRRRRGGRRRRRGGSRDSEDSDSEESDSEDSSSDDDSDDSDEDDDSSSSEDEGESTGTSRRRRRRRRGRGSSDEAASDEVTGIEGSTRMEAKRQRRKENRAAGRRRAPILSEAEFLARRESVDRRMLIRQRDDYTQLAVLEDGILVEHYVDRASATSLIGNIYLGRVQNVLPSMEAAFIDIGRGRNAVLYAGEVDWESFGVTAEDRRVEKVFKSGQTVLVQVTKDPVGAKGARLTGHISLPGRYVVYSPGGHLSGISRKLPDTERARLREILGGVITDDESVIVRTAAEGAEPDELVRDVNRLKAQWEVIEKKVKAGKAPEVLYAEPDLTLRIVRDLFNEDFGHLVVQGNGGQDDAYDAISAYVSHVAPHLTERLEQFTPTEERPDLFAEHKIDEQISKALDRKVYLPSGGSLVIDRTEAMTVIDVNTGRFTGAGGNLEATVTSNNLEAAEEIVRQLRLRDLGGIIVIDFIDMVLPSNRELLLRRLVECLGRDRTRHQVAEVTSLGLVQLTRKRIGTGLAEAFTEECEHCHGAGYLRYDEPVDSQAPADGGERSGRRRRRGGKGNGGNGNGNGHSNNGNGES